MRLNLLSDSEKTLIRTVATLSPGDMGHAVGRTLQEHGLHVITCLNGRSERTQELARLANIENMLNMNELVTQSQLILSMIVPSQAPSLAEQVANTIRVTEPRIYFADCNAISPQTAQRMDEIITGAGGRFTNASIIGSSP